jgi:hypothetical protein
MDDYTDYDDYWGDITSGGGYNDWDDFEQDWADVTSGRYTIDEIAAGDDVRDLYYASFQDPSIISTIGNLLTKYGKSALDSLKSVYTKPGGGTDWGKVAATAGGIYGLYKSMNPDAQKMTGYQGKIPSYTAVREQVSDTYDPERRPGSGGQRYFSETQFVAPEGVEAARTAAQEEAAGIAALNKANLAREERPAAVAPPAPPRAVEEERRPASEVIEDVRVPQYAAGGITGLKKGRYLNGTTDGMADKLAAKIDNKQPAALSHGEFVIPADVVSHLGNGNSDAGAKKLYEMMEKIRLARTGNPKQGKQINPNKFLPA